jgi:hypothetical protein
MIALRGGFGALDERFQLVLAWYVNALLTVHAY